VIQKSSISFGGRDAEKGAAFRATHIAYCAIPRAARPRSISRSRNSGSATVVPYGKIVDGALLLFCIEARPSGAGRKGWAGLGLFRADDKPLQLASVLGTGSVSWTQFVVGQTEQLREGKSYRGKGRLASSRWRTRAGRGGGGNGWHTGRGDALHGTARPVQGNPDVIAAVTGPLAWKRRPGKTGDARGACTPFRKPSPELVIGDHVQLAQRRGNHRRHSESDSGAELAGRQVYAHGETKPQMPQFHLWRRVAHEILPVPSGGLLSWILPYGARWLANYGIDGLAFHKPVKPAIASRWLKTCTEKSLARRGWPTVKFAGTPRINQRTAEPVARLWTCWTMVSEEGDSGPRERKGKAARLAEVGRFDGVGLGCRS